MANSINVDSNTLRLMRISTDFYELARSKKQDILDPRQQCLIRFNNCTKHDLISLWLDFNARPKRYATIRPAHYVDVDTWINHNWIFKCGDSSGIDDDLASVRIMAIPDNCLESYAHGNRIFDNGTQDLSERLICGLCRFLYKNHSDLSKQNCCHLSGAPFPLDKLATTFSPSYIYCCNHKTHDSSGTQMRHNVYLVEPFPSLKELCFEVLVDRIHDNVFEGQPDTLSREFINFNCLRKYNLH